jgi:phosphate transport system substrate-binding protein
MKKYLRNIQLIAALILILLASVFLITCKNKRTFTVQETPTSGSIRIEADESFKPIVDAQISAFTGLYKLAHVTAVYKAEKDLVSDFLNDSADVIVTAWSPTEELKRLLLNTQVVTRTIVVAYDALALVLNRSNMDSLLTYDNVKDIMTGKITNWKQINPKSKHDKISIIFDNDRSGNIRYFREKFKLPDQLPSNFFAVNNNPEVINYVTKNPDALGILSVNWISDREDSVSRNFSNKVRVAGISMEYLDKTLFYLPVQGSIYDKTYPFTRTVNMVTREASIGLGAGFIAWVAGEQGQRIILKSGLVPATMPIRIVQTRKK